MDVTTNTYTFTSIYSHTMLRDTMVDVSTTSPSTHIRINVRSWVAEKFINLQHNAETYSKRMVSTVFGLVRV